MDDSEKFERRELGTKLKLNLSNWTKWRRHFLNEVKSKDKSIYNLLSKLVVPNFVVPDINATEDITVGGVVRNQRIFSNNQEGRDKRLKLVTEKAAEEKNYKKYLPLVVAMLTASVEENIISQLYLNKDYQEAYDDDDLMAIWTMVQFIATGEGADSFVIDIVKFFECKRQHNDWFKVTEKLAEYARKIVERRIPDDEKINRMISGYYILGMRGFKPLERQVDNIISSDKWPDWQTAMNDFRKIMTLKDKSVLPDESEHGKISAMNTYVQYDECGNCMNCSQGSNSLNLDTMKYIGACVTKASKFTGTCFNCGVKGHSNAYCKIRPWAICDICKNRHKTQFHDEAMSLRKASMERRNKISNSNKNNKKDDEYEDESPYNKIRSLPKAYTAHLNLEDEETDDNVDQWAVAEAMDNYEKENQLTEFDLAGFHTNFEIKGNKMTLENMIESARMIEEDLLNIEDEERNEHIKADQYKRYKRRKRQEETGCNGIVNAIKNLGTAISNFLFYPCRHIDDSDDSDQEEFDFEDRPLKAL